MKRLRLKPSWVLAACLVFWGLALVTFVSPGLLADSGIIFALLLLTPFIAAVLTLALTMIIIFGIYTRNPKKDNYTHGPLAKVLGYLIVAAILMSTFAAVRSLWYSPLHDDYSDRFIYENLATAFGLVGIVLVVILSALQKDIYWLGRKKTVGLDERQLQERREVFEASYKLGALTVLLVVWWLSGTAHNVSAILANNYNSIPGHVYWIGANLVLTLFALPLLIAAWKNK